ncbi:MULTISPECIES: hypothetical protein [unclassified Caballeronia]|uniref:hypothetical protein n=1 Tax=unclassified Caballeronia TaxID=2646786 RepID=UPI002863F120|nr:MULTISPECIES: hypothetical protein [unclassified Caballeronia]MDR5820245.1 hypothetical protein [Caballeronia sp. LZ043]MDR5878062.1 hypothetical protein [Caballeronia sp. LZ032]
MNDARKIWTIPLLLAALTLFGLLSALLGTGVWHALAWLTLAVPVAVVLAVGLRRRPR